MRILLIKPVVNREKGSRSGAVPGPRPAKKERRKLRPALRHRPRDGRSV